MYETLCTLDYVDQQYPVQHIPKTIQAGIVDQENFGDECES